MYLIFVFGGTPALATSDIIIIFFFAYLGELLWLSPILARKQPGLPA